MNARVELTEWARSMKHPDAALLPAAGWQFAALDRARSRRAAVLVLFGESESSRSASAHGGGRPVERPGAVGHEDLDLLFVTRAATLANHPGQVAFPGGSIDATDADEAGAALREAEEETGLDPDGIDVIGCLPEVGLPVSNFMVTPVLGWWRRQSEVRVVDTAESQTVFRCGVRALLSADNRRTAVFRRDGFVSRTPAFITPDAVIWGFTAMLLDAMFDGLGWTQPWDRTREIPAPL
jgi:8-oxo-dGTP pyrophosphatase MutT (NUDIX family)